MKLKLKLVPCRTTIMRVIAGKDGENGGLFKELQVAIIQLLKDRPIVLTISTSVALTANDKKYLVITASFFTGNNKVENAYPKSYMPIRYEICLGVRRLRESSTGANLKEEVHIMLARFQIELAQIISITTGVKRNCKT